ncbi:hypothetical protein [Leifsonia sp. Root4]|uniref:hypothetical protein n=1 Tax=Leifsonia sp. Root4 TaxID=1736525 RepID=UPI000A6BDCF6|nr:hypothetical protein [Leifsonia sp. Root4]
MTQAKGRQPQDHKKPKPSVETIEGGKKVTISGITVTVLDEALDDFELLEDLAALQSDPKKRGSLPLMLRRLVGDDGRQAVLDGLRGTNGRVPVKAGLEFIEELFGVLNPNS